MLVDPRGKGGEDSIEVLQVPRSAEDGRQGRRLQLGVLEAVQYPDHLYCRRALTCCLCGVIVADVVVWVAGGVVTIVVNVAGAVVDVGVGVAAAVAVVVNAAVAVVAAVVMVMVAVAVAVVVVADVFRGRVRREVATILILPSDPKLRNLVSSRRPEWAPLLMMRT